MSLRYDIEFYSVSPYNVLTGTAMPSKMKGDKNLQIQNENDLLGLLIQNTTNDCMNKLISHKSEYCSSVMRMPIFSKSFSDVENCFFTFGLTYILICALQSRIIIFVFAHGVHSLIYSTAS